MFIFLASISCFASGSVVWTPICKSSVALSFYSSKEFLWVLPSPVGVSILDLELLHVWR